MQLIYEQPPITTTEPRLEAHQLASTIAQELINQELARIDMMAKMANVLDQRLGFGAFYP
jgi:hypothetical protein